jgi:hypothetical protein
VVGVHCLAVVQAAVLKDLQPFWRLRRASVQLPVPAAEVYTNIRSQSSHGDQESPETAWDKYWDEFVSVPLANPPPIAAAALVDSDDLVR